MDAARKHLDVEIKRAEGTRSMLEHLADVVDNGPRMRPGETYQYDARDALLHGAELASKEKANLEHVAVIYDSKAVDAEALDGAS